MNDFEKRVDEVVKQLTLDEKVQMLRGDDDFSFQGNEKSAVEAVVEVENAGRRKISEVVQLYVRDIKSGLSRPPKELKAFAKITAAPNQVERMRFELKKDDFLFYDSQKQKWVFEPGDFETLIGASSANIRLRKIIALNW